VSNGGIDDPRFIERLAHFVRTHPKVELIAYYNKASEFDLATKRKSLAAYRKLIVPLGSG
jgi:hypothetical protein